MKKLSLILIGGAALGLANAASAADAPVVMKAPAAPPPVSAVIGTYLGGTWVSGNDGSSIEKGGQLVLGGDARVNAWWSPNWSTQFDIEVEGTGRYKETDDGRIMGTVGSHWAWRDPQRGALGIVTGYTMANLLDENGSTSRSLLGLEAQVYTGNVTWYLQGGGTWFHNGSNDHSEWDNAWWVRGVGRWFATPNEKWQAEVGYAKGRNRADQAEPHVLNWGVLYERRLANSPSSPFSVYFEYAGFRYKDSSHGDRFLREHLVMVGVKAYFNQGTLLSNDRTGATFDMPKFMRAQAWSDAIH